MLQRCVEDSVRKTVSNKQQLNDTHRQSFCADPSCWAGITHQHRVLTRNCLRRQHHLTSRRSYKSRRRRQHHVHWRIEQQQQHQQQHNKRCWTPPINADTLKELSYERILLNFQLRHDLVFDRHLRFRPNFDGTSGKIKQRNIERYWVHLDNVFGDELCKVLPVLLNHLIACLRLLHQDRQAYNSRWPMHITMDTVYSTLNPERIVRQIQSGQLDLRPKIDFVVNILQPMCPSEHWPRLQLIALYFSKRLYARGFRQCFAIIEAIQLSCVNQFLKQHRAHLIRTCARYERRHFKGNREIIVKWLAASRTDPDASFLQVYHTALVRLVAMDCKPFPATLQYDQYRLMHQFRAEFLTILILAILCIPYHYLCGSRWDKTDLENLKTRLEGELQAFRRQQQQHDTTSSCKELPDYGQLATEICEAAYRTHIKHGVVPGCDFVEQHARTWSGWLRRHISATSEIYRMVHQRVMEVLRCVSQGQNMLRADTLKTLVGLERELMTLGLRIRAVADLNLATFGPLYIQIWKDLNAFPLV